MAKKDVDETKIVKEKKETKKEEAKKATKKQEVKKSKTTKKNKKAPKVKKETYMEGVSEELKKVKWPSKKEVIKYTIATIVLVLILVAFFLLLDLGMSLIKEAFN